MNQIIKVFFKEIVPIIAGILIAMFINNWNEERKNEKYIDQISFSINKELQETDKEIIKKLPNQKSLIDTLDYYINNNKVFLMEIVLKNGGIRVPTIKINSWRAVSNSKIELLEYEKKTILAGIEEQKDNMNLKLDKMVDFLYANPNETGKSKKIFMKIMIADVINTEKAIQDLIKSYHQIDAD